MRAVKVYLEPVSTLLEILGDVDRVLSYLASMSSVFQPFLRF